MSQCRIIGLTGGIATGKTTVSKHLSQVHRLPVLDADVYAREAVQLGSPILEAIADRYGPEVLLPSGVLNRQRLGEIVFHDAAEKQWLERQIHPYVRDRFIKAMQDFRDDQTVVQAIPLLFEAGLTDQVTEIWVVSCSEKQQLARLMQRDRLSLEQAQARIQSQMPLAEKAAQADVVLDNSGRISELLEEVDRALAGKH
ncbi:MAG: dephospho-CoA kinase [Leptolyngbyaceae cyanobacterium MO_188.B28]|nr:dephospho-CoA kinase [Leptolyngbyaceae cyanobacterium MO_188.B28]